MKIESGKYYKTRDGRKARIYATDGDGDYPICGAILDDNGWQPAIWDSKGRGYAKVMLQSAIDIISEWRDAPIVNWSAMPAWCNYVAMDEDGAWYAYIEEPDTDSHSWSNKSHCYFIPKQYAPTFTGEWKDSLAERKP